MCAGLSLPGNRPDVMAVCYDRAPEESVDELRNECDRLDFQLLEEFLDDEIKGPRCPSRAWNKILSKIEEKLNAKNDN